VSYVLDTTAMSALMRAEPGPSRRLLEIRPAEVSVPAPVLAEIFYGIARLAPSRRRRELEARLAQLMRALPRAPWSDDVSRCFGAIKAGLERRGERLDDFDAAIAAHALAHRATVVTRNVRHFARVEGLVVEDWT
jgi:tRNA(fMet)-specific endonuclease VapC